MKKKKKIFQGRGRPQGNGDKTENRVVRKKTFSGSFKVFGLVAPAVLKTFGPGGIGFLGV